jgi:DNA-binding XRE family transcriptional regulator
VIQDQTDKQTIWSSFSTFFECVFSLKMLGGRSLKIKFDYHMSTFTKNLRGRNKLQICRMTSGYSKKELAHLMGLPPTTISRWENGTRTPVVYYAIGLAVALHRLVDEIFSDYRKEWIEKINQRAKSLHQNYKGQKVER